MPPPRRINVTFEQRVAAHTLARERFDVAIAHYVPTLHTFVIAGAFGFGNGSISTSVSAFSKVRNQLAQALQLDRHARPEHKHKEGKR